MSLVIGQEHLFLALVALSQCLSFYHLPTQTLTPGPPGPPLYPPGRSSPGVSFAEHFQAFRETFTCNLVSQSKELGLSTN